MNKIYEKRERMLWVDSMRGFSMLIVVLGHVLLSMGLGGYDSVLSSLLLTFRMPLFFFVSGFFSYRAISWWNKSRLSDILKRKIQAQIISTIAFLSVFQIVIGGGIVWPESGFGGYWFTIVLFQMYVLYLCVTGVSNIIKRDISLPLMAIFSIAGVAILVLMRGDSWLWNFLCWENLTKYLQFFTLGLIISKYRNKFFNTLTKNWFSTLMIVGWIICMLLWYNDSFHNRFPLVYSLVHDIAVRYFALMTVVIMFHRNAQYFSSEARSARTLRYIGQRTLDIYMIHYFLIPSLGFLTIFLSTGNMLTIQLAIGITITAIIVALCLLISSILRQSQTLGSWLFGVKVRTA